MQAFSWHSHSYKNVGRNESIYLINDGAYLDYNGISTFTSSANVKTTEFMKALGYGAKNTYNRYCFEESSPVANLFLGLKYMIERDGDVEANRYFDPIFASGEVYLLENDNPYKEKAGRPKHSGREMKLSAMPTEVDLRGMDSVEAICVLDRYLDEAMRSNMSSVRIIHGKGTGILRAAVDACH